MNEEQKINRMREIEETALNRFLDKSNFSRFDEMTKEERIEFINLYREVYDECLTCGCNVNGCKCKY